ncbi:hypothetical protein V5799_000058 [Amblyomma americanum]|uniref:Uncharacterized protein n=1 Tax=Amblyomma americanum TaxID=6943 RepID=A0AAQ4D450_AMBAM
MKLKTFMDKQNLRSKGSLLVFLLCALPAACASSSNQPRPLFVFGHMANSLNELDSYMEQGVNAIEADFTFASNGTALKLYHGPSNCFCGLDCEQSTEVSAYLTYLRDSVSEGGKYADKLLLFYADTKTDDLSGDNVYQAGVSLANNLMQNLWMNGQLTARTFNFFVRFHAVPFEHMLNVIVSIFNLKAKDLLKGALDTFSQAENSSLYLDHVEMTSTAS